MSDGKNSINFYIHAVNEKLAVGDKVDFKGSLGAYNELQLRNTIASELKVSKSSADSADEMSLMICIAVLSAIGLAFFSKKKVKNKTGKMPVFLFH